MKSFAEPPWNGWPSIVPSKSTVRRSLSCAARDASTYFVRC
jgi:hypothetical protein